jgi:hypothetical protein
VHVTLVVQDELLPKPERVTPRRNRRVLLGVVLVVLVDADAFLKTDGRHERRREAGQHRRRGQDELVGAAPFFEIPAGKWPSKRKPSSSVSSFASGVRGVKTFRPARSSGSTFAPSSVHCELLEVQPGRDAELRAARRRVVDQRVAAVAREPALLGTQLRSSSTATMLGFFASRQVRRFLRQ